MTSPPAQGGWVDRRRVERRTNQRLGDLTLPEVRRIIVTTAIFVVVLALFLWMVRTVIIAAILGVVIALYLRPVYHAMLARIGRSGPSAALTLLMVIVPVLALLVYSYLELAGVARYIASHQEEIATKIDVSLRKLIFLQGVNTTEAVRQWVLRASNYGMSIPGVVQDAIAGFSVAATIFLFTAFYVLVDSRKISAYVRGQVPPRYAPLAQSLETNARGVLYGAIYSTFLTQTVKSVIILLMNLVFQVPLAAVLAILSFIIGFFPIVGSWSIYVPVAAWLLVFRDSPTSAALMIAIGFFVNTIYISTFLRPKIAAERSQVLNFFWMFVGLVTGVYTFGLPGILLGPILIGLLKAIVDSVTATQTWKLVSKGEEEDEASTTEGDARVSGASRI
jgi:predicted PurR-regulated permease PerM